MLTLGQEEVPVLVSAMRRKSMRLQLSSSGEIDLRIPLGTAKEQVLAFVKQHHDWLVQRRSEFRQRRPGAQRDVAGAGPAIAGTRECAE